MNERKTYDELVKLLFDYKELVQLMIDRANFTQIEKQTMYYLLSIDDIDRLIEFTNK